MPVAHTTHTLHLQTLPTFAAGVGGLPGYPVCYVERCWLFTVTAFGSRSRHPVRLHRVCTFPVVTARSALDYLRSHLPRTRLHVYITYALFYPGCRLFVTTGRYRFRYSGLIPFGLIAVGFVRYAMRLLIGSIVTLRYNDVTLDRLPRLVGSLRLVTRLNTFATDVDFRAR